VQENLIISFKQFFLKIFSWPKVRKAQQKEEQKLAGYETGKESDLVSEKKDSIEALNAEQTEQFEKQALKFSK
jgi:hypothetical protein